MRTITTKQLKDLRNNDHSLTLVNTLAADTFATTRIPGAVNIPLEDSEFASRVEQEAGGKHKAIVVYCASEQCNSSENAAKKLQDVGFTNVLRYTGGAAAWQKEVEEVHAGPSR